MLYQIFGKKRVKISFLILYILLLESILLKTPCRKAALTEKLYIYSFYFCLVPFLYFVISLHSGFCT